MTSEQFNACRDSSGAINLIDAFISGLGLSPTFTQRAYLQAIMNTRPIHSRQVAALAIITAQHTFQ